MSAGERYVAAITARDADLRARAAFLELAQTLAAPGSNILDFGAGPGLDAKHYAQRGFRVLTYDVDPQMCDHLLAHCRDEISRNQVVPCKGQHREWFQSVRELAGGTSIDLITANFAPFNLIDEPRRYFAEFYQLVGERGKLLLSVLNPYFFGDIQYRWWWRNAIRMLRRGEYSVAGGRGPIYRRSPQRFKYLAEPYFTLRSVMGGLPRWPSLASSQYLFLVFDKCH
jgi:SAM-dependent methyltransferase